MGSRRHRNRRRRGRNRGSSRMSARKFYSFLLVLVLCTVFVIAAMCALSIFFDKTGRFSGENAGDNPFNIMAHNPLIEVLETKNDEAELPEELPAEEEIEEDLAEKEVTPVGALIWPIKQLEIYESNPSVSGDTSKDNIIAKIDGGESLKVEALEDKYFLVEYEGKSGYVNSDFCLINLPDFLGDLLEYNITNSYSSIFMAHDYKLYGITGTVIPGYENVKWENDFLVPYMYPCALKLETVARRVLKDGYKLKIYDAFRPHKATAFLYDSVNERLLKHVPLRDENGEEIVEYDEDGNVILVDSVTYPPLNALVTYDGSLILNDMVTVVAPAGSITQFPAGAMVIENGGVIDSTGAVIGTIRISEDGSLIITEGPEAYDEIIHQNDGNVDGEQSTEADARKALPENYETETYSDVITGGRYRLSAFLAASGSAHNKGIALDLTLCDRESLENLEMQTAMHDLSYHSVLAENNDNANLLAKYMTEGGFNDLVSEWWHFQDDESRKALGLNYSLEEGISP